MKISLISALAFAALAGSAMAATSTNSSSFTSSAAPFTKNLTLNAFDSSLGTLTAITLTLDSTSAANIRINDTDPSNSYVVDTATGSVQLTLNGLNGSNHSLTVSNSITSQLVHPGLNTFTGAFNPYSESINVSSGDFSLYTTSSAPTFVVSAVAGSASASGNSSTDPGFLFYNASATAAGTATVTYTYTPVPEPSTYAGFGAALVGIAGMARSRRRKA